MASNSNRVNVDLVHDQLSPAICSGSKTLTFPTTTEASFLRCRRELRTRWYFSKHSKRLSSILLLPGQPHQAIGDCLRIRSLIVSQKHPCAITRTDWQPPLENSMLKCVAVAWVSPLQQNVVSMDHGRLPFPCRFLGYLWTSLRVVFIC